jgi:hypothetical protein
LQGVDCLAHLNGGADLSFSVSHDLFLQPNISCLIFMMYEHWASIHGPDQSLFLWVSSSPFQKAKKRKGPNRRNPVQKASCGTKIKPSNPNTSQYPLPNT